MASGRLAEYDYTAAMITPRWEWRSFGARFGEAEKRLAALPPSGVQESDELYLLSGAGDNVKVREELMDIKVLREVNADGLEQWTPVMKAGFPIRRPTAAKVFEALGCRRHRGPRRATRSTSSSSEFAGAGRRDPRGEGPQAATRYTVGGCMAELSDVVGERQAHADDRGRVGRCGGGDARRAGARPGRLHQHSYPRGLAALIDDKPARYAVIDVGTNSVKFHIGERDAGGKWRTVVDRAEVTRLGEGLGRNG